MTNPQKPAIAGRQLLQVFSRLVRVSLSSGDARRAAPLFAIAVALELAAVYGTFRLGDAERRIMDALEQKDATQFFASTGLFVGVVGGFVLVSAYRIYVRQVLEIRWRRALTGHYLERWVNPAAYSQAKLRPGEVDNPDQRIAEDVRDFVGSALGLSLSLLSSLVTLASFGGLLWALSRHFRIPVDGRELRIPGLLLWVAIAYAVISTWLTHLVGRRLVPINFERLRREADFRYGLVRFRDTVETVALSRAASIERLGALDRFRGVVENWWQLIAAQRNLALLTTGIGQANALVPLLVTAPAYIAGHLTLGSIVQIRFAYGQVSGALSWFVYAYQEIARWRANVERLATFADAMDATARDLERAGVQVVKVDGDVLRLSDLQLDAPDGHVLFDHANATARQGDRVVITGPSGAGKTVLLRAVAGIWPFGKGRVEVPVGGRMLFLPQRPYLPLGSLRAVLSHPTGEGAFSDERIGEVLRLLGLGGLTSRLGDVAPWDQQLSGNEQQRLAIARVLLNEPDWVFLDKATSELGDEMEERVYDLLAESLPHAALIWVADRPAVEAHHPRRWTLTPRDHGPATFQTA